jgi:hypothetical protein
VGRHSTDDIQQTTDKRQLDSVSVVKIQGHKFFPKSGNVLHKINALFYTLAREFLRIDSNYLESCIILNAMTVALILLNYSSNSIFFTSLGAVKSARKRSRAPWV